MKKRIFSIEGNQLKELEAFENEHKHSCFEKYNDVTGALFSYEFIPNGLGTAITITCECGEKLYLSDMFD